MKILKHPLFYIFFFSMYLHCQSIETVVMEGPDNPRDYERAVKVSNGEYFPIYGMEVSKKNVFTPGGFAYFFMSIPHLFSDHPYASVIFLRFLSSLTVFIVFFMAKDMGLSVRVATLASLFFAVNLNVNILSQEGFSANYVLIFGALFFWVLYRTLQNSKSVSQIFLLPLFAVTMQMGLAHISLGLVILCCFILFRKKPLIKYQVLGMLIFVILYLPYIVNLFITNFKDMGDLISVVRSNLNSSGGDSSAFLWPLVFSVPISGRGGMFLEMNIFRFIMLVSSFIFGIVVLIFPIIRFRKNGLENFIRKKFVLVFIVISIFLVIIVNLLCKLNCRLWHCFTIIPLIAILQAIGFEDLCCKYKIGMKKWMLYGTAAIFVITSVLESSQYISFLGNRYGTIKDHQNAISYMQLESINNYSVVSDMNVIWLNGLYILAKYNYKVLPKHPKGMISFPFNQIKLPFPDNDTITYFYHYNQVPDELSREQLPDEFIRNVVSMRDFGAFSLYRLN